MPGRAAVTALVGSFRAFLVGLLTAGWRWVDRSGGLVGRPGGRPEGCRPPGVWPPKLGERAVAAQLLGVAAAQGLLRPGVVIAAAKGLAGRQF